MDLGAKFGIALGSDSDSSDAEFAPENEEKDSADSECGGGSGSSGEEGGDEEEETEEEIGDEGEGGGESDAPEEEREQEEGAGKGSDRGDQEGNRDTDVVREEDEAESQESGDGINEVVQQTEEDSTSAKTGDNLTSLDPAATKKEGGDKDSDKDKETEAKDEYNPLIVRRSNRAIKPTKDVDLYLLGAKFGIDVADVEASGAESSDMEFAPAEGSPGILVVYASVLCRGRCCTCVIPSFSWYKNRYT